MSFGGEAIDQVGPTSSFPAASMLTGLIGNALGLRWRDRRALQRLQDRLTFAAAILQDEAILTDNQNAQLSGKEKGWTTLGTPEGRDGASFKAPHRRRRDYLQDGSVLVVLRLDPANEDPDLGKLKTALDSPARPLFIGRKSCLPTRPIFEGQISAPSAHDALSLLASKCRAIWPEGDGPYGYLVRSVSDRRNWLSGLHGGSRVVVEGRLP